MSYAEDVDLRALPPNQVHLAAELRTIAHLPDKDAHLQEYLEIRRRALMDEIDGRPVQPATATATATATKLRQQ